MSIAHLPRVVLALLMLTAAIPADEPDVPQLRVMSFNIRYGTAKDGDNHWDKRCEFLTETITAFKPDLLGTQETLRFQRDYLAKKLSDYEVLGVGRNDGADDGEMMALYFRTERFELLGSGHFWLSETPGTPGSTSWDSSLPRMATWVKLLDRQQPETQPVLFLNTHFDHKGTTARLESARLLRKQVQSLGQNCSAIVTGDFNAAADSEPHAALFGVADGHDSPLLDTYRTRHPAVALDEGTFSGFSSAQTGGARIDWIGVSRDWTIHSAEIDHTSRDGRTPSDHFPITTILARPSIAPPRR